MTQVGATVDGEFVVKVQQPLAPGQRSLALIYNEARDIRVNVPEAWLRALFAEYGPKFYYFATLKAGQLELLRPASFQRW